jgi:hypothetical protein
MKNINRKEIFMEKIVWFSLGIAAGVILITVLNKQNKNSDDNNKNQQKKLLNRNFYNWINCKLEEFSKSVLAYYLDQISIEKRFVSDIVNKIYEKYGKQVSKPSLYLVDSKKFFEFNVNLKDLDIALTEWLKQNGCDDIDVYKDVKEQTEKFIYKTQKEKAKKIIDRDYNC